MCLKRVFIVDAVHHLWFVAAGVCVCSFCGCRAFRFTFVHYTPMGHKHELYFNFAKVRRKANASHSIWDNKWKWKTTITIDEQRSQAIIALFVQILDKERQDEKKCSLLTTSQINECRLHICCMYLVHCKNKHIKCLKKMNNTNKEMKQS